MGVRKPRHLGPRSPPDQRNPSKSVLSPLCATATGICAAFRWESSFSGWLPPPLSDCKLPTCCPERPKSFWFQRGL